MNQCPSCNVQLVILQENLRSHGFTNVPSDRSGEIRGCKQCGTTYFYGPTRADEEERWMPTPFKFHEFSRAKNDYWDAAWRELENKGS